MYLWIRELLRFNYHYNYNYKLQKKLRHLGNPLNYILWWCLFFFCHSSFICSLILFFQIGFIWDHIDTIQPCDTTQVRSDSDFSIKNTTVQVHGNSHNSRSDHWIKVIFYVDSPDMFFYLGLKLQVNWSSGRHDNTGQQRLYEFCYLLPFDL